MQQDHQYMIDFTLPKVLSEDFLRLIPHQRSKINQLFREGRLINYALSLDNSKMWAVVNANSEVDVLALLDELPLTRFLKYRINMLTFFNAATAGGSAFSMN